MFDVSPKVQALRQQVEDFIEAHVYPNERRFYDEAERLGPWQVYPVVEEIKPKAKAAGLWNLFLPQSEHGAGLTNFEYAPLCEVQLLGSRHWQHGSAGTLWNTLATRALADPVARG
jgi:acyl-CoA dehydrogenase